jgi:hypothetical protein
MAFQPPPLPPGSDGFTTVKVSKATMRWLTSLKGYIEHKTAESLSFDSMVRFSVALTDYYMTGDDDMFKTFAERRLRIMAPTGMAPGVFGIEPVSKAALAELNELWRLIPEP